MQLNEISLDLGWFKTKIQPFKHVTVHSRRHNMYHQLWLEHVAGTHYRSRYYRSIRNATVVTRAPLDHVAESHNTALPRLKGVASNLRRCHSNRRGIPVRVLDTLGVRAIRGASETRLSVRGSQEQREEEKKKKERNEEKSHAEDGE